MTKSLNLQYLDKSDIKYDVISFPDGEKQLNILDNLCNYKDDVNIVTRITNGDDLFLLLQAYDILDRNCIPYITTIKYLMTQRSDRLFSYNRPCSLKVMLSQLKGCINVLEPHNREAMNDFYNNLIGEDMAEEYRYEVFNKCTDDGDYLFFPDNGAKNRYSFYCKEGVYFTGMKVRDVDTGRITNYKVVYPFGNDVGRIGEEVKTITIVDDLCDGGSTFILAYNELKKLGHPNLKINLDVVHAVQEAGLRRVCEVFDNVTVTNSYADWDKLGIPNLTVRNVW